MNERPDLPGEKVTVPEDLRELYRQSKIVIRGESNKLLQSLIERLGAAELRIKAEIEVQLGLVRALKLVGEERDRLKEQLAAMTIDRDLWQGEHDDNCPYAARVAELEEQVAIWKDEYAAKRRKK